MELAKNDDLHTLLIMTSVRLSTGRGCLLVPLLFRGVFLALGSHEGALFFHLSRVTSFKCLGLLMFIVTSK